MFGTSKKMKNFLQKKSKKKAVQYNLHGLIGLPIFKQ